MNSVLHDMQDAAYHAATRDNSFEKKGAVVNGFSTSRYICIPKIGVKMLERPSTAQKSL